MKARSLATILGVLLVGCSIGAGPSATTAPRSEPAPEAPPPPVRIGPDGPEPPDPEDLLAYGRRHRDTFGGLYLDGNQFFMLFTDDLETHSQAVSDILPGTKVRQVRFTEEALVALLESLDFAALEAEGIQMVSAGLDTIGNKITLDVKSNDPTVEVRLELAHGGMLDVTVFPVPGEWAHATEGDGWRLLASGRASGNEAYTVRAATGADSWAELWEAIAISDDPPPPVDFGGEVVVSFAHGIGSSCPELRLDGVRIEGGVIYSQTSDPLAPRACTADLGGAATFVVALDRDALPDGGFTLRLARELITCGPDCGGSNEEIEVSLP